MTARATRSPVSYRAHVVGGGYVTPHVSSEVGKTVLEGGRSIERKALLSYLA